MTSKTTRVARATLGAAAILALSAPSAFAFDDQAEPINVDGTVLYATDGPNIGRIAGKDRVATAIKAACSDKDWATPGLGSDTFILASSDDNKYADALASAPLADILEAPILVTPAGGEVDPQILDLLVKGCDGNVATAGDNKPFNHVVITSGTGVLTSDLVAQLQKPVADGGAGLGLGSVERFSGANRYQTSERIANEVRSWLQESGADNVDVFLADGDNFPDALAAGAAAAQHNGVVLLTMGATGLDQSTFGFVSNAPWAGPYMQHRQIWAVGGNAEKAAAKGWQGEKVEATNVVVGADRYDTAAMLAEQVFDGPTDFVVASGEKSADAIFAGGFAANHDAPLLLTATAALSKPTEAYLVKHAAGVDAARVLVFGGTGSVTTSVSARLVEVLPKY